MADNYATCLLATMDRLWFHQIILFSEPTSLYLPQNLKTLLPASESLVYQSSMISIPEEEVILSSSTTLSQDDSENEGESDKGIELTERPTRLNNVNPSKTRSHSSSPSTQKRSRKLRYLSSVTRLQKTMSCKSLWELEEEEVMGFIDLGFTFDRENICPRMMSVLPGLQRLGGCRTEDKDDEIEEGGEEEQEVRRGTMLRPYLSEAWIIKRPDSPLLNLRIPKASTVDDMKKHLKYWAKTVASEILQES